MGYPLIIHWDVLPGDPTANDVSERVRHLKRRLTKPGTVVTNSRGQKYKVLSNQSIIKVD